MFAYIRNPPLGLLIHFNQAGLYRDVVYDLAGWTVERRIEDNEVEAIARLKAILNSDQQYALLNNNCEHLVSYVETGERKSPQVRGLVGSAAVLGAVAYFSRRSA
ncbi:MAG TPA: lecithin retinol acyltransferase family protein [Gemmatimonadales bacterium]|nr:lecithin retinol acyltransferase family protein [Gemmatimonadales bacterium]